MKIAHLSRPQPNMSLIGEGCDSLGTDQLSPFGGDHWATGGLRVNLTAVKGGLISFPLFLLEGNALLPMLPKADCAGEGGNPSHILRWLFFCSKTIGRLKQASKQMLLCLARYTVHLTKYCTTFCICSTPNLRLKKPQRTQRSKGVCCLSCFLALNIENFVFVLKK